MDPVYKAPANPLDALQEGGIDLEPQRIRTFEVTFKHFGEVNGYQKREKDVAFLQ